MTDIFGLDEYAKKAELREKAGLFHGRHYTTYVEEVKQLKRENKLIEAEKLLLTLIYFVEQEGIYTDWGLAPWYYEQLAIIYRKQLRYQDEISILERYCQWKNNSQNQIEPFLLRIKKVKTIMRKAGINP